jgi:hypothetical protein
MVKINWKWVAGYIRAMIIPDFNAFSHVVTKRLLPSFDTFGDDALKHGDELFRSKIAGLDLLDSDQYEAVEHFADETTDETLAFADMLVAMYSASVGLYSVGLFHLFEQHFTDLPLEILEAYSYDDPIKLKEVIEWLKAEVSIDVTVFPVWSTIDELRLVANTIKHAEGGSAKDLRSRRPDLFIRPAERKNIIKPATPFKSRIRKPLFGEDLYLTMDDFLRYGEGVIAFWAELADNMEKQLEHSS